MAVSQNLPNNKLVKALYFWGQTVRSLKSHWGKTLLNFSHHIVQKKKSSSLLCILLQAESWVRGQHGIKEKKIPTYGKTPET